MSADDLKKLLKEVLEENHHCVFSEDERVMAKRYLQRLDNISLWIGRGIVGAVLAAISWLLVAGLNVWRGQ